MVGRLRLFFDLNKSSELAKDAIVKSQKNIVEGIA